MTSVVIDGPSGSGKSTVSRRVARDLGFEYLDTGAMYRAATWWCLHLGIDLGDEEAVIEAVRKLPLEIDTDPLNHRVNCGGNDITDEIRKSAISRRVSEVSTIIPVREILIEAQREHIARGAARGGIVAEGRDLGTVVAPDATVRILLTASEQARLARRTRELHGQLSAEALDATRAEIGARDAKDSTVSSFLSAAGGVTTIDSTSMELEQVVDAVKGLINDAREQKIG